MPDVVGPEALVPFTVGEEGSGAAASGQQIIPYKQQEVLFPGRYLLRHIAPKAVSAVAPGIVNPLGQPFTVLGQTLYAAPLPVSHLPSSPDFHEGDYTLRLGDAGDFKLSFPNRDASSGQPWRSRFSAAGHTHFIEISHEGNLEFVGVITKVVKDRQKIVIEGFDGFWLLRKAYEQDFTGVLAPRDLIERYSQVYVPVLLEDWSGSAPFDSGNWNTTVGGGSINPGVNGLRITSGAAEVVRLVPKSAVTAEGPPWFRARVSFDVASMGAANQVTFGLGRKGSAGAKETTEDLVMRFTAGSPPTATLSTVVSGGSVSAEITLPEGSYLGRHTMEIVGDGRWAYAYMDGQLVGVLPFSNEAHEAAYLEVLTYPGGVVEVSEIVVRQARPFLLRGASSGDFVLPGTAATYPTGGLHARWVATSEAGNARWFHKVLAPDPRRNGFPTFTETQEPTVLHAWGLVTWQPPGIPTEYFAVRFFGAIYLDLEHNAEVAFALEALGDGARLWVGDTRWGHQIIDDWKEGGERTVEGAVKASVVGAKKGWFPIILEYFQGEGAGGIELVFNPPTTAWTDPGGTVIKPVGGGTLVPATSLSPLGCVDARIQGSSHFDQVQEALRNAGYQAWCEPKQLESGEFPGQLVPSLRVGRDTDEVVEPDDVDRRSGMDAYTQVLDATDSAASLRAFGSGIADGKGSQIAFEAVSIPDEEAALFDMQAWVSAGDIAYPALLEGRAGAELQLRRGAWENLTGEPIARDRLADTFPLTGVLSAFRWHPGDGVRLLLPDVGVFDANPRAMLQIGRQFGPDGRMNTHVGFRARPKDPLYALRQVAREATRPQRAYQHQYVTRSGNFLGEGPIAAGAFTGYSLVPLLPGERVVSATVHISLITAGKKAGIEINGTMVTTRLGGPWLHPAPVNVTSLAKAATPGSDQRMWLRFKNEDAEAVTIQGTIVLTLLA